MDNNNQIPSHIKGIVAEYNMQIAFLKANIKFHEKQIKLNKASIADFEIAKQAYLHVRPYQVTPSQLNSPLSKNLIRDFLRDNPNPIRTVEMINLLYPAKNDQEKTKLIKVLSVMLNTLAKEKEIEVIKRKGVKGNYYKWIQQ